MPKYLRIPVIISGLISSILMLISLVAIFELPPVIPIFYSLPRLSQHLGYKEWIFLFPVISFLMTAIHLVIIREFKWYHQLILQLFAWTSVGLQLLWAIAEIRILLIVL